MTTEFREYIKTLSSSARDKFSRLIDYIIELKETTPSSNKSIPFRPIFADSFSVEQQYNMLSILKEKGVLMIELREDEIGLKHTYLSTSLEILYQIKSYFGEIKPKDKLNNTKSKSLPKRELHRLLADTIKTLELGKKEKDFLKILSDFNPHKTASFTNDVPTKNYKKLKQRAQKKLAGTDFNIKRINPGPFRVSYYQLIYLPRLTN